MSRNAIGHVDIVFAVKHNAEILAYQLGIGQCQTATLTRYTKLGIIHVKRNFRQFGVT